MLEKALVTWLGSLTRSGYSVAPEQVKCDDFGVARPKEGLEFWKTMQNIASPSGDIAVVVLWTTQATRADRRWDDAETLGAENYRELALEKNESGNESVVSARFDKA